MLHQKNIHSMQNKGGREEQKDAIYTNKMALKFLIQPTAIIRRMSRILTSQTTE